MYMLFSTERNHINPIMTEVQVSKDRHNRSSNLGHALLFIMRLSTNENGRNVMYSYVQTLGIVD